MIIAALKVIFLGLGITYGTCVAVKAKYKVSISSAQVFFFGFGIAGFIILQFCL